MINYKNSLYVLLLMLSSTVMANQIIFDSAKNQLDLNARYINIEYNSKLVENFCPKQSVGLSLIHI